MVTLYFIAMNVTHLDVSAVVAAHGDEQGEAGLGARPVRLFPLL